MLLYYSKLCNSVPCSLLGRIHRHRSRNWKAIPVGFYSNVHNTLTKYGVGHLWRNININQDTKIKDFFKKFIWLHHWKADVSAALKSNSIFASVFLPNKTPPKYPFKSHKLLNSLTTEQFPRIAMARVLRFWLTPARNRVCSCGLDTGDLAKHLLFHCSKTHSATAAYASSLEPQIISHFTPNKLIDFLRKVVRSEKLLENFNLLVGTFEYPRY